MGAGTGRASADILAEVKKRPTQCNIDRFIVHMRQRLSARKLGLLVGSGAVTDAGLPTWPELTASIERRVTEKLQAADSSVRTKTESQMYRAQILHAMHTQCSPVSPAAADLLLARDVRNQRDWGDLLRDCLYDDAPRTIPQILKKHRYLDPLAELARNVDLTITFNFDDTLERCMVYLANKQFPRRENFLIERAKIPETVWEPQPQPAPSVPPRPVVYHPNGFIPYEQNAKRSPNFVLTESAFADVLLESNSLRATYILSALFERTFLVIGTSLNDTTFTNVLARAAHLNPGQHHYYVHFTEGELGEHEAQAIFDSHLEMYNLITLFLNKREIAALLNMISASDEEFSREFNRREWPKRYVYYVTGAVGSGKSTVLSGLRAFGTIEEWIGAVEPLLHKRHDLLTDKQREAVNTFIVNQMYQKQRMIREQDAGIFVIERGPMDFVAFSKSVEEVRSKCDELKKSLGSESIRPAHAVILEAPRDDLLTRNALRGRRPDITGDEKYLGHQQHMLMATYPGAKIQSSSGKKAETISRVSRHIIRDAYEPINLKAILGELVVHGLPLPEGSLL